MTPLQLIQQYAAKEFAAGDNAAVLAVLNSKTIEKTSSHRWTMTGLCREFGYPVVKSWMRALVAADEAEVVDMLKGEGINLSDGETLKILPSILARLQEDELMNEDQAKQLAELGVWTVGLWMDHVGRDATLEELAAIRANEALKHKRAQLNAWFAVARQHLDAFEIADLPPLPEDE